MKKKLSIALSLVLALSLFAGCSQPAANTPNTSTPAPESGSPETSAPVSGGTLRFALPGDTGGFDPATGTTATPQQVIKTCYRGLFSVAPDGSLKNELCTSYDVSDDGLVYTFHLRDDVKWSDGVPVTAHDFVYGWQRNLVPALSAAYCDLLGAIVNFDACMSGEKELDQFGAKALDDYTLEVTLAHTQPYFVQQTTFSPFYPVREDKVTLDSSDWSIDVENVVTNGPFMFQSYAPNDRVVVVPNPEYYEKDVVKLDSIEYIFIPDQQTSVAAFKNGEVDMVYNSPIDIGSTHDNSAEYTPIPYLVNNILVFSGRCEALSDVRVRKAINMAINREQLSQICGEITSPLYALIPHGITNPAIGKDFREEGGDLIVEDIAQAQQLMADAGYPNGEGFPELTYLTSNSGMHADIAVAIQAMLKENLGITLNLNILETQAFSADRRAGNFDICRLGTSADYNDPMTWLSLYDSSTAYMQKVAAYSTPEYDEIIKQSDYELDQGKRFEMLHEAEEVMINDAWWIPLLGQDQPMLTKEYVKGWSSTTAGDVYVYAAYIEQ